MLVNRLLAYLPPYLQEYVELVKITDAEYPEIQEVRNAIDLLLNNEFINTLNDYGCKRWESMLKIVIQDTDTLEIRRMRILSKLLSDIPYTERALRNVLTNLCGEGMFSVVMGYNDYTILIWIEVESMDKQKIVTDTIDRMLPANLALTVEINFRSHGWLHERLTHRQMQPYTHVGLRTVVLENGVNE